MRFSQSMMSMGSWQSLGRIGHVLLPKRQTLPGGDGMGFTNDQDPAYRGYVVWNQKRRLNCMIVEQ